MHQHKITPQYCQKGDKKCLGVVERFNRTIKPMIEKYLTSKNSNRWVDRLKDFTDNYNSSYPSGIQGIPERLEIFDEAELIRTNSILSGFSHRLARYVVHQDNADCYGGFAKARYQFSSDEVLNEICIEIAKFKIEEVKEHLIRVNRGGTKLENSLPVYLERIFELSVLTTAGLQWKYRQMYLRTENMTESIKDWGLLTVKLNSMTKVTTKYENMDPGVLYYPSDRSFPLVDMYYKDEHENLIGIQATTAKAHAKDVSVYEKFYQAIDTSPEKKQTPLVLFDITSSNKELQ